MRGSSRGRKTEVVCSDVVSGTMEGIDTPCRARRRESVEVPRLLSVEVYVGCFAVASNGESCDWTVRMSLQMFCS